MKNQNLKVEIERKNVKEQKQKFWHVCLPWMAHMPGLTCFFKGRTIPLFLDNSSSTLTDDTLLVSP